MKYMEMKIQWYFLLISLCSSEIYVHALSRVRVRKQQGDLSMEPSQAIVLAGANITFTCSNPSNATFLWDFPSRVQEYDVAHGMSISNVSMKPYYFSKITLFSTTTLMSGEIACSTEEGKGKAIGFLIVNGVRNGGPCHNSTDCITDRAVCLNGICDCPPNQFRIRHPQLGYDVCREVVQSLYDPCEFNEQCIHFVDSKSICNTVCVCAPHARDRKGRCVSLSEISYNRSQEMYRVGLIAVTCIIILIVAMSLWVTLKRSCQERNPNHRRSVAQANSSDTIVELSSDKPPSYDDVLVSGENVSSPPNIKEALKNCMTAKRLLRQVSAPAGQLLTQTMPSSKPGGGISKKIPEM